MSLIYEDKLKMIPENKYLFSVTSLNIYKHYPFEFFRKILLKEQDNFANFNTILGTIIHHLCSEYLLGKAINDIKKEIVEYVDTLDSKEFDKSLLLLKFNQMYENVIQTLEYNKFNYGEANDIEKSYIYQLTENVYIGGTLDLRIGSRIVDYKTSSNKYLKDEGEITDIYLNQLYGYAWLCYKHNIEIANLSIQYFTIPDLERFSEITHKPLKGYPCRSVFQNSIINGEIMQEMDKTIYLIAETIEYILKNPKSFKYFGGDLNLNLEVTSGN